MEPPVAPGLNDNDLVTHFFALSFDMLCVADSNGYFIRLNPSWMDVLGYSLEELMAKPYVDFVHPDDLNATIRESDALQNGRKVITFENRYRTKQGGWKWLSWNAVPQEDGLVFAVARDVTAEKLERQHLDDLVHKLERANHELDQFAHVVSHDLKSPLRAMMSLSEFIVEDMGEDLSPEVKGHVKMLRERVAGMNRFIEDLLNFARAGTKEKPVDWIDLNSVLAEVISGLECPEGYEVELPDVLQPIQGHWVELVQVFQNLLANAIKYRAVQNGNASVKQESMDDMWIFSIQDNGIGVPLAQQERIFKLFKRAVDDGSVEGTGLGLALVKKIVEGVGGRIWVNSEEGKGATFKFTWPKTITTSI
jgi:PAS domain S-box-containing protein